MGASLRIALALVPLALAWYLSGGGQLPMPLPSRLPIAAIDPSRLPQPGPLQKALSDPRAALRRAQQLFEGQVEGAESVAVAGDGTLYLLDKYGHLHTAQRSWEGTGHTYHLSQSPVAYTGPGRPLGSHFDTAGNLIICDSLKGLTMLEAGTGRLVVLANRASPGSPLDPDSPINYANDLDIAADGRIYFSDSTAIPPALNRGGWYDTMRSYLLTQWQGGATGRLLSYDPSTRQAIVLAKNFWYANGVSLAPDGSFVAVVETCSMRVQRYWLAGPKALKHILSADLQAGTTDTLIDALPGYPDGISRSSDGNFWIALLIPNVSVVHKLLPHRLLRWAVAWTPQWLLPKLPQWGMVVKVSPTGQVLQVLQDPDGSTVSHVSAVTEHEGQLFLGNLAKDYVSVLPLAAAKQ